MPYDLGVIKRQRREAPIISTSTYGGNFVGFYSTGSNYYAIHVFTSSGQFTKPSYVTTTTAQVLVVAGGGPGATATAGGLGGGGGAGGVINSSTYSIANTLTIYVGAGGTVGVNGSASTVTNGVTVLVASGGGRGGAPTNGSGAAGGSGGGGSGTGTGGASTSTQGNVGGGGGSQTSYAGGGGGASTAGGTANASAAGQGGSGTITLITGSPIWLAGGGGGGANATGYNNGSYGGGGAGGNTSIIAGIAGAANSGGGGGGGGGTAGVGGAGGGGIVIISYAIPANLYPSIQSDPYFSNNALLLNATSSTYVNSAVLTYSIFADQSTNGFAITNNGAVATTLTPFDPGSYHSLYFSGSNYLTVGSNNNYNFIHSTTAIITIEFWVYPISLTSAPFIFSTNAGNAVYLGAGIQITSSGNITFTISGGSTSYIVQATSSRTIPVNAWSHVAVTWNYAGNTGAFYINGNQSGTFVRSSGTGATGNSSLALIVGQSGSNGNFYNGYVSNLRLVNGTVVYTGNFIPSLEPLSTVQFAPSTNIVTITTGTTALLGRFLTTASTIADYSTLTNSITNTGVVTASTLNPFTSPVYESVSFNGSTHYLSATKSGGWLSSDHTLEAWIYINAFTSPAGCIAGEADGTGTGAWEWWIQSPDVMAIGYKTSSIVFISGTYSFALSTWYHVAVTRSGTTVRLFVNGTQIGSGTISGWTSQNVLNIGRNPLTAYPYYFNGYISNFRIVNGIAVYTGNFTAPTGPLQNTQVANPYGGSNTQAISTASLLTLRYATYGVNSISFIDYGTNNNAISPTGNPGQGTFSPFGNNWSTFFNGLTDYLSIPVIYSSSATLTALNFGTNNWTIETWAYLTANTGTAYIAGQFNTINTAPVGLSISANKPSLLLSNLAASSTPILTVTSPTALSTGTWNHIAAVRNDTRISIYVNGVEQAYSFSANPTTDLSINTGTLASTNVTFSSLNPYDQSMYHSLYFDGTSYLNLPTNAGFNFGTGPVTMECWVYPITYVVGAATASETIDLWTYASGSYLSGQCQLQINSAGTVSFIYATTVSAATTLSTTAVIPLNAWTHLAVVRNGTSLILYINGVNSAGGAASITVGQALGTNGAGSIGRQTGTGTYPYYFNGYISNVRVVKGTALYTASPFLAPQGPLSTIQNSTFQGAIANVTTNTTQLLVGRFVNPNRYFFDDYSSNNFTLNNVSVPESFSIGGGSVGVSPLYPPIASTSTFNSMSFYGYNYYLYTDTSRAFDISGGTWTIEFWMYSTDVPSYETTCCMVWVGQSASNSINVVYNSTSSSISASMTVYAPTTPIGVSTVNGVISLNTWYHVAVVSNAGNASIYINGSQSGSTATITLPTSSQNFRVYIGHNAGQGSGTGGRFQGYMSNIRIVNGTAIYTGNFATPTAQLTNVPSTSLLIARSSSIIGEGIKQISTDFSLRSTTSTINGATLSPSVFWPPISSSTSTLYNSVNYASTGSVILYSNSDFASNSSFTVECWVWMNSLTTSTGGILSSCSTLYGGFIIARDQVGIYTASAGTGTSITWTFPTNAWTHVALTCDRFLTISAYLNGVAVSGSPKTYTFGSLTTPTIGLGTRFADGVPNFIGYISNVRFVNNHVVYTGNFTVPTGTLTATQLANPFGGSNTQAISTASYTKLLTILSTTVTNIVDYSTNTFAISIGSGTVSLSTLDPFSVYTATNYHSLYFNGNSSISVTSATGWLVHGDHTVEAWVNLNTTTYSNMLIAGTYNGVGTTGWEWSINNYYMTLGYRSAGALTTFVSTSTTQLFLPNTWNHVAFSRLGTTASMYVNGIRTTVTQIVSYTEQNTLRLGYFGFSTATSTYLTGYISNFRIVSGVAVYTGTNFVPPTGLLTTQQPPNPYAGTNTNAITFNTSTRILTAEFNGISIIPFNTTTNMLVGRAGSAVTSMFPGYLSNLRIVNGTAVYTSAFVPPSAPLPLITNTSLLVAASGYHVDKSTNNFIVTTGTIASLPNITKFTPYKIPGEYNKSIVGGSVYFNTSTAASQNLNIGTASTLALGSGNYTVECWVYAQSYNALNSALIDWRTNAGTTAGVPVLYMLAAGNIQWQNTGGTGFLTSPAPISLNTWNHVAMVRYNSILYMYINGVVVASVADSTTLTIQTLFINSPITASNQTLFGFISNVRILVGRAIYTPTISVSTTTLTTVTNTVLLALQNDAPVLKDNSTNNFALTKPNTSTVFHQVLSPFGGQGSAYFNGSNNYLTVSTGTSLAFNFDVNDFTLEAWVYPTARNGYYGSLIIGPYSYPSVINWALIILSSGNLYIQLGSSSSLTSSSPVPLNQWSHVACVRNSGILTLYINGQIVGNISDVTTVTNTINVGIGAAINGSTATLFTGYITNLHVIKNYAKYTSAFTSPTDDITTVTNTSLLTLLSTDTTFIDRSLNSFAITTSTTATTFQSFSAYSTASWSTYFDGSSYVYISSSDPLVLSTSTNWTIETWVNPTGNYGVGDNVLFSKRSSGIIFQSMFFNGTSQYLSISTSTGAFAFGSNDWTIECWFYGYGAIIGRGPTDADDELYIAAGSSGQFFVDWGNASEYWQSATGLFSSNQWTHLAVVRSLSTLAVYQNGVSIGASAGTNIITRALTNNYAFRIGQARIGGAGSYFAGYIANLRVVNGIAVYTGNFNPPTGLLSTTEVANAFGGINTQAISVSTSTSLLIGQFDTSNSISDLSAYNSVVTNNNAVTVSLNGPIFYNSIQFNGANQYLTVPAGASTFGTGDFTVEGWFYKTAATASGILNNATGSNVNYWTLSTNADGTWSFQIRDTTSQFILAGNISSSLNTWVHVAATRTSGLVRLFVNGVFDVSSTSTKTIIARTTNIGSFQFSDPYKNYFAGYISNVRLITGTSLYSTSTSFTVPTAPLSKYIPVGAGSAADSSSFSFVANAAVDFTTSTFATGTGDFTAECWVYMDPSSNAFAGFMTSVSSTVAGFIIARDLVGLFNANGAGLSHYFAWTVPGGVWTHVALTLRSGQLQAWLNGVSAGAAITRTDVTPAGTTIRLAGRYTSDTGYPFVGYISNARFVVGVGVYTGNFTVPTQQLQTTQPSGTNIQAITDARSVQLLTAQTNSITDFSTTATSVSVTGSVSTTTAYNPSLSAPTYSLILSSAYFYTPADTAFQFGTGDFTIECWFYYIGTAPLFADLTQYTLISNLVSSDNTTWDLQYYNGNWRFSSWSPTFLQGSGSTLTGNTWYHIAVTRASGQGQIWLNGVSITGSVAFATNLSTTAQVRVGGNGISAYWNGYISNVRIIKGLAVYSNTFTPPVSMLRSTQVGSGNIQSISTASLVSLLTGQSNAIIDNSKNNFSLTNGGAGIVNAITPFATSSTYDASYTTLLTANFIGTATSITDNSSNNYTITQTNNPPIDLLSPFGGLSYTTTSTSYQGYLSSGTGYLGFYNGTTYSSSTTALSTGTWNHVAYTYDGNVNPGKVNIYVNGFRVLQTTTNIISDASENLHIGGVAGATENFYGYMSNFRIVKDSSLYLGSYFGVPSAKLNTTTDTLPYPLTSTIKTSLLTLQDNRIVDKSINAHSLTVSGTPKTITFSPFAANPNISAYFNGTSDFINVAAQTALSLGVGDFNIEVWVYPTAVPTSYAPVLDARTSTASVPWIVGMQTVGGVLKPYFYDGTTRNGATTIQLNVWTHLAYSRTNSILRMFVNGAIDYTSPNNVTNMLAQGTNQFIGKMWDGTGNMFQGYMSNLRVVNGRSLYTGNFNPSQIPLAQAAGGTTNLLATFVDGRSINYSGNSVVKANTSSVTLSTSPTKYNNYSLTFNGTNDFLTVSSSTVNVYNSNDFTWEMWVYPTSPIWATTSTYLVDYIGGQGGLRYVTNKLSYYNATTATSTSSFTLSINSSTWTHLAVSRATGVTSVFVNGAFVVSTPDLYNFTSQSLIIGNTSTTAVNYFQGYIEDLRITKGVARYTSSFVPPTKLSNR